MENKDKKNSKYHQKRLVLSSISRKLKAIRQTNIDRAKTEDKKLFWATRTINDMLMMYLYNKGGDLDFKTFHQWKQDGKTIKKGAKAVTVWGQPTQGKHRIKKEDAPQDKKQTQEDEDFLKYEFYPICYLFSSADVVEKKPIIKEIEPLQEVKEVFSL